MLNLKKYIVHNQCSNIQGHKLMVDNIINRPVLVVVLKLDSRGHSCASLNLPTLPFMADMCY